MLKDRLAEIRFKIETAAKKANRNPSSIKLLAVSKTMPVENIVEAIDSGHMLFGENYFQEAKEKINILTNKYQNSNLEFHFIGHLQRNKAKDAVGLFSLIQTVDNESLVEELQKQAAKKEIIQKILIQINISGEESKSGVSPDNALGLAKKILDQKNLSLQGLMCIGTYFEEKANPDLRKSEFVKMSDLKNKLEFELQCKLPELSMGMSHDFDLAIEYGATIVRVGTAIFGTRN